MEVSNSRKVLRIFIRKEVGGDITGGLNVVKENKIFFTSGNETVTVQTVDLPYWDVSGHKNQHMT